MASKYFALEINQCEPSAFLSIRNCRCSCLRQYFFLLVRPRDRIGPVIKCLPRLVVSFLISNVMSAHKVILVCFALPPRKVSRRARHVRAISRIAQIRISRTLLLRFVTWVHLFRCSSSMFCSRIPLSRICRSLESKPFSFEEQAPAVV